MLTNIEKLVFFLHFNIYLDLNQQPSDHGQNLLTTLTSVALVQKFNGLIHELILGNALPKINIRMKITTRG